MCFIDQWQTLIFKFQGLVFFFISRIVIISPNLKWISLSLSLYHLLFLEDNFNNFISSNRVRTVVYNICAYYFQKLESSCLFILIDLNFLFCLVFFDCVLPIILEKVCVCVFLEIYDESTFPQRWIFLFFVLSGI